MNESHFICKLATYFYIHARAIAKLRQRKTITNSLALLVLLIDRIIYRGWGGMDGGTITHILLFWHS